MPAGTLESFKTAFLPTLSRALDERLKALEAPLLALGDQVTLLGRLAHPELDRHQRTLEEAREAAQELRELAKTSVFEATAGVADLEDQVQQSGQAAALAITSRRSDLLQKARQAVTALEKNPASAWLANDVLPGLKQQLSEGEKALDSDPAEGARVLGGLPTATVQALEQPAKKLEYEQRKLGVEQALQALKAHLQRAHIAVEISRAETDLLASTKAAKANKPMDANLKLGSASQACRSALPLADRYAQYRVERARAAVLVSAVTASFNEKWMKARKKELTDADDLAASPTRQYVPAEQAVAEVCRLIIGDIVRIWDTGGANKIQALRTHAEADFVSAEIQALERVHGDVQGFITARAWHKAVLAGKQVSWGISPIKKIADRRQSYSAERVKALQAIDDIKGVNALFAQVGALRQRVELADRMAERKVARFEDGIATLKEVVSTATTLKRVAKDAASCKDQLAQARERLDKLEVNITTAHIEPQLAHIRTQLARAEENYNSESYEAALKLLAMVSSDLDGAEGLAGALGGAVEAQQRAHGASEGFEVLKCIDELKGLAEQAQQEPHADLASHEFTHISASLDEARSQLAGGQVRIALIPLQGASDLLVTARTVQTEHARFLKLREALQGRVDNLRKAKAAKGNKPNIDRVADLLEQADKADQKRDWVAATEALRYGALDADIAEIASQARETWEARAAELLKRKKGFNAGPERTAVEQALTDSEVAADQLDFTRATTLLDTAESRMDALRVADLAGRDPTRPEIVTRVRAMMRTEAGPALIDALVQNLPMKTPVALFTALARERFGVELTLDEDTEKWEAPTAKKLWEMLAKVPEGHARNNPSLKIVRREDPKKNGGFYRGSEDLVVMKGRPSNDSQQSFGSRLRSNGMPCFPDPVEESCRPVNEDDVNYFDFATLHEVGHAVDDRLGFMSSRQRQDAFGGWISHGSDLGPIADAVAQAKGYDPEYVLNLMLKKKDPVEPPPPEGRDPVGWNASRDAVKAWYALATMENAYRRQPLAEQSAIGDRVYQQAYSHTWVSYKLDARRRGLTGYQFRAPGEWFAELYAGYHSGKIKNGHPSAAWLKTL